MVPTHAVRVVEQRTDQLFVQSPRGAEIDVLHAGWILQAAIPEPELQHPV